MASAVNQAGLLDGPRAMPLAAAAEGESVGASFWDRPAPSPDRLPSARPTSGAARRTSGGAAMVPARSGARGRAVLAGAGGSSAGAQRAVRSGAQPGGSAHAPAEGDFDDLPGLVDDVDGADDDDPSSSDEEDAALSGSDGDVEILGASSTFGPPTSFATSTLRSSGGLLAALMGGGRLCLFRSTPPRLEASPSGPVSGSDGAVWRAAGSSHGDIRRAVRQRPQRVPPRLSPC